MSLSLVEASGVHIFGDLAKVLLLFLEVEQSWNLRMLVLILWNLHVQFRTAAEAEQKSEASVCHMSV